MLTVLGNTTVDIVVRGLEQLPGNGAKDEQLLLTRERVSPSLGGSGARSAFAGAALGELTRLWSAVGGDSLGELALNWLEGRKVDTTSVRISGEAGTSTNIVLADAQTNVQTIHYPGASAVFAPRARSMLPLLTRIWRLMRKANSSLPRMRGQCMSYWESRALAQRQCPV